MQMLCDLIGLTNFIHVNYEYFHCTIKGTKQTTASAYILYKHSQLLALYSAGWGKQFWTGQKV